MAAKSGKTTSKTTRRKVDKAAPPGKASKTKATSKATPRATPKARTKSKAKARGAAGAQVIVVNMVPKSLSGETNQDSEPSLAVNPANPLEIVGTAFTPDPMGGALAPVYISTDGGNTWRLNSIVPSAAGSTTGTSDISLAYASKGGLVYGGILSAASGDFETLRTTNVGSPAAMQSLASRSSNDQPFSHAITNGFDDRVYIGNNDFLNQPKTATVDVALAAQTTTPLPKFKSARIETRKTVGQDGPQVRPVAHADGTVYATFYGWRSQSGNLDANTMVVTTDVVVVRDDLGGVGKPPAPPFSNLNDHGDGLAGRIVARGVKIPFRLSGDAATGQQRLGGSLSIAIDPRDGQSKTVYLAWTEIDGSSLTVLHVRKSTDGGATWSPADLLTLRDATNAALAVNSAGTLGLLCQELTGSGSSRHWKTQFRWSTDGGTSWNTLPLADTPASVPAKSFDPYLGDYDHLVAVGPVFYGIFSANNTPDLANFPSGVKYQRNANFRNRRLLGLSGTTTVAVSIDPFFFKVSGV
jgi:hypothetical protein